jgi:hypothetical protein
MDFFHITVQLDLEALGLRHAEGSTCPCAVGDDGHQVVLEIDLEDHGLHDEADCRADILETEGTLQSLHEQAHPKGAVYAENCREPGCVDARRLL